MATGGQEKAGYSLVNVGDLRLENSIPIEILNMDDRSIQLFEEALKAGKENMYNIRVMVVGHLGVGKTTMIKRLLGEEVDISERNSTEGINVYVNCCDVSLSTCEWTQRKKDAEQDYQLQRLATVLNEQQSMRNKVTNEAQVEILPQGEKSDSNASVTDKEQVMIPPQGERTLNTHEGAHGAVKDKDAEILYRCSTQQEFDQNLSSTASQQDKSPTTLVQRKLPSETNTMAMLKLLQENANKLKPDKDKNSPLTLWDFAGQYAFYTTHQTFLTRRAIYLLVSDASIQVTDLVADECYFDSEGIMKRKVHELIEVWLNSIHSCAPYPDAGIPPVILVGTHVDKISQKQLPSKGVESETQTMTSETVEFTQPSTSTHAASATNKEPKTSTFLGSVQKLFKSRKTKRTVETTPVYSSTGARAIPAVDQPKTQGMKKERVDADKEKRFRHEICERYFKEIRSYLSDKPTRFHLIDEDFAIDNTVVDSRLEDLKRKIVEVASQQPYWGEEIPARWIPLEQELIRLKAAGIKVIPRSLLEDLNKAGAVQITTDELDLFLRFQHDIGTILYFSTEVLKDKIVLDPQWMIDALKSLITAEMFVLRSIPAVADKWFVFKKSGKLSPELIDAIWTKENKPDLHNNKEHILLLMEHLNIIAKPRCYSEDGSEIKVENYFLVPCMLRQRTPREVIFPESHPDMENSSVLCYIFVGKFLPPPIFHRLLATCVTHWPIAKDKSENLIFCGSCIFDLDIHHRLTLFFTDYIIFARVTRMGTTEKTPSSKLCVEVREFITRTLSNVIGYLGQSLQFELSIRCPKSDGYSVDSLIPVVDLQGNVDIPCHFHDNGHMIMSQDVLKFWFQDEEHSDDGSSAGPMPPPPTGDTDRFMRLTYLLVDVGSRVLRQLFSHHTVTVTCTLDQYLAKNRSTINSLLKRKVFHQSQMDILFPPNGGNTNIEDYDVTLLSALFNNIVPSLSQQEEGMIKSLREDRNKLYGHAKSCKMNTTEYQTCWNSISSTLITLSQQCGDPNFENEISREIQQIQVSAIPTGSYLDILKTWFSTIETVKGSLQALQSRVEALESKKTGDESEGK